MVRSKKRAHPISVSHLKSECLKADLCVDGAGKTSPCSRVAGRVLQAETGLVSLSHFLSGGDVQQVIVAEGLHAVEMSAGAGTK